MKLDERKKKILGAIVDEYIETAEPVSSGSLLEKAYLDCSSATIRNEMAELEKIGFLEKTHTDIMLMSFLEKILFQELRFLILKKN